MKRFAALAALALLGAASPSPQPSASPAPVVVHISEFTYKPQTVTIHAGDSITFVNDDGAAHTATADDKSFDSGNLDHAQSWTHLFNEPGTYRYICTYHAFMKATIVVQAVPK